MRRFEALWTTTLGSVESSADGTPHFAATASMRTRRAWAPASRIDLKYPRVAKLADVWNT